jgi:probable phosphoglycerate mutase
MSGAAGPAATRLCIVRHGETAWNAEHRVQGQVDAPLNELGHAQARAVAAALAGERFDAAYASDLSRARMTAEPAARRLGLAPVLDAGLRERHYGMFETLTYAEVRERYPADYARFAARDPDYDFRTGEALRAFYARSIECIASIAQRHAGRDVLVFTHGGVLEMIYRHAKGLDLSSERDFRLPNAAINRVEVESSRWRVTCWADCAHLGAVLDDV